VIRKAQCAGTWYPVDVSEINSFFNHKQKRRKVIAGICPHAGWIYSGKTAGEVYSSMEPASIYVLVGPNHYGLGEAVGVYDEGRWETPLGSLEVSSVLAQSIVEKCRYAKKDKTAHSREHSLEVQMPFIKVLNPNARIVPVALADYRPDTCRSLGEAIAQSLKEKRLDGSAALIASTDMSHYLPGEQAEALDRKAIKKILDLDPEGLLKVVENNNISMCGSGPAASVIWAAKNMGAKKAELLEYTNSGKVTKDYSQVVGYAGLIIT
jgi:AmmeMemoRadiSam system protein B